jgi:predicted 3-demethylubiquinone-9 3-methyltransferase (glyoxalase superfamily)
MRQGSIGPLADFRFAARSDIDGAPDSLWRVVASSRLAGCSKDEVTLVLKVSTCLWHGKDLEEAVRFYVSLLPGSEIEHVLRSPGPWPGGETGDVILVSFTLAGQNYQALNGGAPAEYGTAASIAVACPDQAEVDRLWAALAANGGSEIACGWLRDRWGVPWQIFPEALPRLLADPDPAVASRVFLAMQGMVKLDLAALQRAAAG